MQTDFASESIEFLSAIEDYKKENDKLFLSWSEVLHIVKKLGYRKAGQQ